MNKYPNKDVEDKVKAVEEFAKKNDLGYLYLYSDDEDTNGNIIYSIDDDYLNSFAYMLEDNELAHVDKYIIYINSVKFMSRNA